MSSERSPFRRGSVQKASYGAFDVPRHDSLSRRRSVSRHRRPVHGGHGNGHAFDSEDKKGHSGPRPGALPRPVGGSSKLGTFSGVFVPTVLNVLSILLFLRFGMILGQSGLLGMLAMLSVAYLMNLITTLSVSAIATNGTVRGGGAYYLISRSLGPEFGGSIGIILYLGFVFNTGMNAVGLIDCLKQNFGTESGNWSNWLPEGTEWQYLGGTVVLVTCTAVCLAGSSIFARASNGLLIILLLATFSIPVSSVFVRPFRDARLALNFTGYSLDTLKENLLPRFTKHAAGSAIPGRESFQDLFGILYPATAGIFAGASMSGDLKHPSKAIPKGTLYGLALTFCSYAIVIISMACTISRKSFYQNVNVVQDTNLSGVLVLMGECATSLFSVLMGVIGSAKLLQALARDDLIPGLSVFGQGTKMYDEPTYATIVTYLMAQLTMLFDINQIASLVTMTFLMTFLVTNLACFLLKIGSAPNFRPSFRYFNWQIAAFGTIVNAAAMFFVDGVYATGCIVIIIAIFLVIHYTAPTKSWGDVSQSLIYHQVRKYLLRLRQEHVKFWRPQILLLVNDPRRQYKLIQFCNALKKGSLFVLGHVIVSDDFGTAVPEARHQQSAWTKYIDFSKIKAFVNICISPTLEWGTRNVALSAGLGGMRPNIAVMGAFNLDLFHRLASDGNQLHASGAPGFIRRTSSNLERMAGDLPTDANRSERDITPSSYVTILEDLILRLQLNVAIAKGFRELKLPGAFDKSETRNIDLWPIQMSAEFRATENGEQRSILTTNFDTYTLILQLGCILNTVDDWKSTHSLRVAVFVEYESDVEEEQSRVESLLSTLRIKAEVLVFWLASGSLQSYEVIVNGAHQAFPATEKEVDEILKDEEWWHGVQTTRGRRDGLHTNAEEAVDDSKDELPVGNISSSVGQAERSNLGFRVHGLRRLLHRVSRRRSSTDLSSFPGRLTMTTTRLQDKLLSQHAAMASASEDSDSSSDDAASLTGTEAGATSSEAESPPHTRDGSERIRGGSQRSKPPFLPPTAAFPSSVPSIAVSSGALSPIASKEAGAAPEAPAPKARPRPSRRPSANKFSSNPVPRTAVATDDGPGPSVMFAEPADARPSRPRQSIYDRGGGNGHNGNGGGGLATARSALASGFPADGSVPLSFNDLPGRAQHLILNELMRSHSGAGGTAVVFTTLPGPLAGTGASEEDSVAYLGDLEVLCDGLPPVLLVHSNSMTVTTNL